jgi:hypothetical protein
VPGCLPLPERSRLVADALKDSLNELRKEDEARMSRYVSAELKGSTR